MAAKKPRKKPCPQKPSKDFMGCVFWNACKCDHDANKCRVKFGDEADDIEEID